jgi:thiol-disulfide isomerase/thioredoxin
MKRRLPAVLAVLVLASSLPGAVVPRPAPELDLSFFDGKQAKLSQYKGKVVILEFMLTTCPGCHDAAKVLEKISKEYGPKGVQVIGVAVDHDVKAARALMPEVKKRTGATFPVALGVTVNSYVNFLQHPIMQRFMVPQVVFIDRNGVIQAQYGASDPFMEEKTFEKNVRAQLGSLLKPAAPSKPKAKSAPKK